MALLLPIDELNRFTDKVNSYISSAKQKADDDAALLACLEELEDEFLFLLMGCLEMGVDHANDALGSSVSMDTDEQNDIIFRKVDGKDWQERWREHFEDGTESDVPTLILTESHRVMNEAALEAAEKSGCEWYKTWVSVGDDRVRDTHVYLDGMKIPGDAMFYVSEDVYAPAPGLFGVPEEDCNCRCGLKITAE